MKQFGWIAAAGILLLGLVLGGCTGASAVSLSRAPDPVPAVTVTAQPNDDEVEVAQRVVAACAGFVQSSDNLVDVQEEALNAARLLVDAVEAGDDPERVEELTTRFTKLSRDAGDKSIGKSYREDREICGS